MEEEYEAQINQDNWIESVNILTGKRVCFRVQDITRAEEGGSFGGTKLVYLSGYECEITMDYDDFCEIRRFVTGGQTFRPREVENQE